MENTNRNDATEFFEKMPYDLQLEAIRNLNRQKKPPDFKPVEFDQFRKLHDSQLKEWERVKADRARKDSVV